MRPARPAPARLPRPAPPSPVPRAPPPPLAPPPPGRRPRPRPWSGEGGASPRRLPPHLAPRGGGHGGIKSPRVSEAQRPRPPSLGRGTSVTRGRERPRGPRGRDRPARRVCAVWGPGAGGARASQAEEPSPRGHGADGEARAGPGARRQVRQKTDEPAGLGRESGGRPPARGARGRRAELGAGPRGEAGPAPKMAAPTGAPSKMAAAWARGRPAAPRHRAILKMAAPGGWRLNMVPSVRACSQNGCPPSAAAEPPAPPGPGSPRPRPPKAREAAPRSGLGPRGSARQSSPACGTAAPVPRDGQRPSAAGCRPPHVVQAPPPPPSPGVHPSLGKLKLVCPCFGGTERVEGVPPVTGG